MGTVLLVVGALFGVGGVLLGYGLTSEYGSTPNGGGSADARMWLSSVLPLLLGVGGLCWLGLIGAAPGWRARRRAAVTAGAVALTAVASVVAVTLGQRALENRCVEQGASHSAACPGFAGPP